MLEDRRTVPIVRSLQDPALERALEVNRVGALADMASGPGGEVHDEPGIYWSVSSLPWNAFNVVGHCELTEATIDAAIVEKQEYYRERGRPLVWWATPYTRPTSLVLHLTDHGFAHRFGAPGMACDLTKLPAEIPVPAGTTIERVGDVSTLAQWVRTCITGFGESETIIEPAIEVFKGLALRDGSEWHCYLASVNGQPAASAATMMTGGVAGIYWVGTLPAFRRQSLGAAVTAAALRSARDLGYRVGTLTSSQLGYRMYQRLGFRDYAYFHTYVWTPA